MSSQAERLKIYDRAIALHDQYNIKELSDILQIPYGTVYDWLNRGSKPKIKLDTPPCPYCGSGNIKKNGKRSGKQIFRCNNCLRNFTIHKDVIPPPFKLKPVDLGWLAGLIDGEGCFTFYKTNRKKCKGGRGFQWAIDASISNTSMDLLNKAAQLLKDGVHIHNIRKKPHPKGWKPCYILRISVNRLRQILAPLIPHLTAKKRQAELFLEALKLVRENVWWQVNGGTEENDQRLEQIYQEMKVLNRRGVKIGG